MANMVSLEMEHLTRMGGAFTTEANGFGDVQISTLYKFFNRNRKMLHGQLGFSIPTGSIKKSDTTPASAPNETVLPYPMQLGSGTFDMNLALTYLGQGEISSFGIQLRGIFRLGKNNREYAYGNRYGLNNWIAIKVSDWLSFSTRLEGLFVSAINGSDTTLNPLMVVTADTENSGGTFLNGGLGFNIYAPDGVLKNLRFGCEVASPLVQDINGIQLKTREIITIGTQYSF